MILLHKMRIFFCLTLLFGSAVGGEYSDQKLQQIETATEKLFEQSQR